MKYRLSLSLPIVCAILLAGACGTSGTEPAPPPAEQAPPADAFGGHPDPGKAEPASADRAFLDADRQMPDVLLAQVPQVGELFEAAEKAGVIAGWEKFVGTSNPDFSTLDPQSRALAVGQVLSDVGFHLVLLPAEQTPDPVLLDRAARALKEIDLPSSIRQDANDIQTKISGGQLQGKAALHAVEDVVRGTLPTLQNEKGYEDVAHTALFGAFLRSTAVAANGMLATKDTKKETTEFLKQVVMADFFIAYFERKAAPAYKDAPSVRKALDATKQARDVMAKTELTADDVKSIATLFADYSG